MTVEAVLGAVWQHKVYLNLRQVQDASLIEQFEDIILRHYLVHSPPDARVQAPKAGSPSMPAVRSRDPAIVRRLRDVVAIVYREFLEHQLVCLVCG